MKISAVYKIESRINPKRVYIGSSINVFGRWEMHICDLKFNRHHSCKLQRHYNKYGKEDLIFSILSEVPEGNLLKVEQDSIDFNKPYFNECLIAGRCTGFKHTIETRKLMSEHSKGMRHSEETKKKMSQNMKGIKKSIESRNKMSIAKKGKPTWNKGKRGIYSEETLKKMRISCIGRKPSMLGKKHTEESKSKMSETRRIRWQLKKTA